MFCVTHVAVQLAPRAPIFQPTDEVLVDSEECEEGECEELDDDPDDEEEPPCEVADQPELSEVEFDDMRSAIVAEAEAAMLQTWRRWPRHTPGRPVSPASGGK